MKVYPIMKILQAPLLHLNLFESSNPNSMAHTSHLHVQKSKLHAHEKVMRWWKRDNAQNILFPSQLFLKVQNVKMPYKVDWIMATSILLYFRSRN